MPSGIVQDTNDTLIAFSKILYKLSEVTFPKAQLGDRL